MSIVVTGGTGYLGSRLVERLVEQGESVKIASRSCGQDITRPETLHDLFRDARVVFHLAALVQSRPGAFEEVNLQGLQNVLELCEHFGVERLIYVSSFTIFGPSGGGLHSEDQVSVRREFFHGYDRSKYLGYQLARQWRRRVPLNIVFPTVIFGPGPLTEGNLMARLFRRWWRWRLAPLPGGGRPRWNFVYVDDVAGGLLACRKAPEGEDFILGGENCSLRELASKFREVSGRSMGVVGLSDPLFKSAAWLEDRASQWLGLTPLVVRETSEFFLHNWQFSSAKAQRQLDYRPRRLQEGLRATVLWMTESGID